MNNHADLKVKITDDNKFVIICIGDREVQLEDSQVNRFVEEIKEKQNVAKACRNGWIAVAGI